MVRFSCFSGHILSSKPKKTLQPSFESYHKTLQDSSRGHISEGSPNKTSTLLLNSQGDTEVGNVTKHVSSADSSLKSEDVNNKFVMESETFHGKGQLKKSQSLGSGLYQEGRISVDDDIENGIDQGYSCDGSNDLSGAGIKDGKTDGEASPTYRDQNAPIFEILHESSELVNVGTVFSIEEDQSHSEKEHQDNSNTPVSDERAAAEFSDQSLRSPRGIVKSCSLPNLGAPISTPVSRCYANLGPRSRSFEDFHVLRWKDVSVREMEKGLVQGRVEDANTSKAEKAAFENFGDDNYDSCHYSCLAKDWIMPVVEKVDKGKSVLEEPSVHQWVELPNKDFKIKRIEEWVKDLQHCSPLDETDEPVDFNDDTKGNSTVLGGLASAKMEDKMSPGMESAKRYISSLSPAATTAQLANHGLVVIPFLSAFVSLRVLNLSGNAIVKITSGALPRGLHTLNLSKNGISTIEGLRELTRLRILDLSYNRILRIGHGLASCSSLKELYLAGNKISEVEGLHRLLKLTVLDLRFNKISTAKCLGQLAANYNSLQAISLEGNPAQKNVGDDQLKKHLQGLLPHLAYFNRQAVKAGALKDSAERSVRLGAGSHQFDRGGRADHKSARKGSHVSAHGRGGQAAVSAKPSKGRHGRLPPTAGTRPTASHRNRHADFGSRILNLRQEPSTMRRSRSEGTLGAL